MPITRSVASAKAATPIKNIQAIYVKSKDGSTTSKVDLTALSKIVDATLVNKGIVQLQTEINDNETNAATPKAVNTVKAIADANTAKINEIEQAIDEALPGEGSLADKLKDVAFTTKDNEFAESQTIVAKDATGTDTANVIFKTSKLTHDTGAFDPGTTKVIVGTTLHDKNGKNVAINTFEISEAGRDATLGLVDSENQNHGIRVHLDQSGSAASVVAYAPDTPTEAAGQEIATAKFVKAQLGNVEEVLVDATDSQRGLTLLSDTPDAGKDAASGKTAATPKAVYDVDTKVGRLTAVVGEDAEHAALVNAENEFEKNQTIKASAVETKPAGEDPESEPAENGESALINYKLQQFTHTTGTYSDESYKSANVGTIALDSAGEKIAATDISINDSGDITAGMTVYNSDASNSGSLSVMYDRDTGKFVANAPATPDDASGTEIVTAAYLKEKVDAVQDTLVDATDSQRGLTLLSDEVNSDKAAADGKTAATPKAVKTVNDALTRVTDVIGADAEHAALINKDNEFTESQHLILKKSDTSEASGLVGKSAHLDATTATFDDNTLSSAVSLSLADKNGVAIAANGASATATKFSSFLKVHNKSGSEAGSITLEYDTATEKVVAHAPNTDLGASGSEIATADFVMAKVGDLDSSHVAYTNKDNVFTKPQTLNLEQNSTTLDTAIKAVATGFDHTVGSFDSGSNTSANYTTKLVDKNSKDIAGLMFTATTSGAGANLTLHSADGSSSGSLTLSYDKLAGTFTATAPETATGASGSEIATAKFVTDKTTAIDEKLSGELDRITSVIGEDAENAALVNKSNTFTQPQKIQAEDKILNLGGEGVASEGSADDALVLGSSYDGIGAEIIIAANGSISRSELPPDPDDLEIATVGYVKSLGDIGGSLETGNWSIAMYDFTREEYQGKMDDGVFYSVPFNAEDQYIQIDPETGKPATSQAPGVSDNKVDHFVIMYKAPTSKLVMNLGERKIAPDFNDVPLLSKDNTFTGTNIFKDAQKATPSVEPDLSDVHDNSYITKSELVAYFQKFSPWNNVVTEDPDPEEMVAGQLYFVIDDSSEP